MSASKSKQTAVIKKGANIQNSFRLINRIRGGACSAEGNLETLEALAGRGRRERKILPFFYSAVLARF